MLRILLPLTSQITISYPGCYVLRPPLSPLAPRAAKRHYLSHPWQNQYEHWLWASHRTPSCFLRPICPSAAPTSQATTRSRDVAHPGQLNPPYPFRILGNGRLPECRRSQKKPSCSYLQAIPNRAAQEPVDPTNVEQVGGPDRCRLQQQPKSVSHVRPSLELHPRKHPVLIPVSG